LRPGLWLRRKLGVWARVVGLAAVPAGLEALEVTATAAQTTVQKEMETKKVLLMLTGCPMFRDVFRLDAIAAGAP